jgi:alpha-D-xyloside xylohydrolase
MIRQRRPLSRRLGALVGATLAAVLVASSCSSNEQGISPTSTTAADVVVTSGGAVLRVRPSAGEIVLEDGAGAARLRFPLDAIELGVLATVDDATNYDPYRVFSPHPLYAPLDVTWADPTSIAVTSSSASSIDLALTYADGHAATLHVEASAPGRFSAKLSPTKGAESVAFFRLRPRADAKEGFYGLGESYDDVNMRGKVRAMQLELDPSTESGDNEAHVPVPMLLGTTGWGLFVESRHPGAFSVARDEPDLVEAAFGTGTASKDGLAFHLFVEAHPLDLTRHYYEVTGVPLLPARWALGPWVWRDENEDQAQVEADLAAMRDLDLATTAIWLDRPYASSVESFDFDPKKFTDAKKLIDEAHALGFRMALWQAPYLETAPASQALHDEAVAKGYYPPTVGLVLKKQWGSPIDLTNPDAYAFWQGHVRAYTDLGIEGFKLDYAEDVLIGLSNGRNAWKFHDGSDERTMHAGYQPLYHRVYGELLPKTGGFLLCRAGTYGDQKNVSVIWPGDLDARAVKMGDVVKENGETWTAVGGLPASLIAGLTLGPSGFPFFGADTGGYRHAPADKETFTRWFEQTALSTVMQIGNEASTVAWEKDPASGWDDEMLGWYRTYTRLHLRLFPYEWTYATELAKTGRPIARPFGLAHPELGVHPSDQYFFGDHLLVAPVLAKGQTKRDVVLPAGTWVDFWTGETLKGPGTVHVDAPLSKLPLFLAGGGIVPLLRPTIDTTAPTTAPDRVDSYATTPGVLHARVARGEPGATTTFTVFDGAKLSSTTGADGSIDLASSDGSEFTLGTTWEVIGLGGKPKHVTLDGAPLGELDAAKLDAASSGYSADAGAPYLVYVKVPKGNHTVVVTP